MNQENITESVHLLVFDLLAGATRIERRLDQVLSNSRGVSFTEYRLLAQLAEKFNGRASRVQLADAVLLTPSAVTRALKPLEKMGYVDTLKGQRDARHTLAVLTDAGSQLLEDARVMVNEVIAELPLQALHEAHLRDFLSQLGSYR